MGTLTIRNVKDDVIAALKARAKANHRSLEGELRVILERYVDPSPPLALVREQLRTAYGVSVQPAYIEPLGNQDERGAPELPEGVSWLGCMADSIEVVGDILSPASDPKDWEVLRLPDVCEEDAGDMEALGGGVEKGQDE